MTTGLNTEENNQVTTPETPEVTGPVEVKEKKKVFAGTSADEFAVSTSANEIFKLGTGHDTIKFNASEGFGKDTVTLTKGETLDLDIVDAKNLTYEVKGKDVVVTAKAEVSYVVEAFATGTMKFQYEGDNEEGKAHEVTFTNKPISFTLQQYTLSQEVLSDQTKYSETQKKLHDIKAIMWKSDFTVADENYDLYQDVSIYLDNDDCKAGSTTDGYDINYSEIKVYKVVNGEKIDITAEYKASLADAEDYFDFSQNKSLLSEQGKVTSTIILKNMASKDLGANVNVVNGKTSLDLTKYLFDATHKKNAFTGTWLNEEAVSSTANETFKLGTGKNVIDFTQAEGGKFGKDTVTLTKGEDLTLNFGDGTDIDFERNGNNITLKAFTVTETTGEDGQTTTARTDLGQVVLKDYLKGKAEVYGVDEEEGGRVNLKDVATIAYGKGLEYNKAQTLKGSFLNEIFTGGAKADKIYTGAGKDTVTAGAGKDTIYVNGTGTKTINIGMNDGNDTINMSSKADLKLNFNVPATPSAQAEEGEQTGDNTGETPVVNVTKLADTLYTRKGNDLIIENNYTGTELGENGLAQTTTIKNYFKYEKDSSLTVNGVKVEAGAIKYEVAGSTGKNTYNFASYDDYSEIVVTDKKGNDIYNLDFTKNVVINDKAGKDTLNLGVRSDQVSLFFDVNAFGDIVSDDLVLKTIDAEGNLSSGKVTITDYFGKGYMETVTTKENDYVVGNFDMYAKIDAIASAVESWLADNTDYKDAMAVLDSGNQDDIASLMNVYTTGTYTKPEAPTETPVG